MECKQLPPGEVTSEKLARWQHAQAGFKQTNQLPLPALMALRRSPRDSLPLSVIAPGVLSVSNSGNSDTTTGILDDTDPGQVLETVLVQELVAEFGAPGTIQAGCRRSFGSAFTDVRYDVKLMAIKVGSVTLTEVSG